MFLNYKDKLAKMEQAARDIWRFFLDLIFPVECLGCGREAVWLCGDCFKRINLKARQYCFNCKRENDFGEFCPACRADYYLDGVWIASSYDDQLISQAIKNLKYRFVGGLADDLGKLLILFFDNLINRTGILRPGLKAGVSWREFDRAKRAPAAILNFKANLIIPVPLSVKRRRWRGFNQAEILGRVFAGRYGLEMDAGGLIRVRHNRPQAKLDEKSRLTNVKDCFTWRGRDLKKRNIVLIDDVATTGATLNECAKVLKANDAGEVWALVVAKG